MQQISNIKITQKTYTLVTIIVILFIQLFYLAEWATIYQINKENYNDYQKENPLLYQLIGCLILSITYLYLLYYTYNTTSNKEQMNCKVSIILIFILMLAGQIITFVGLKGDFVYFITYGGISTIINNILIFMLTLPILYFGLFNFQENEEQEISFQEQQFTSLFVAFLMQLMQTFTSSQVILEYLAFNSENTGTNLLNAGYIILIVCNYLEYNVTKVLVILTKIMMAIGIILNFIGLGNTVPLVREETRFVFVLESFITLFIYLIALFTSTLKNKIKTNQIVQQQQFQLILNKQQQNSQAQKNRNEII